MVFQNSCNIMGSILHIFYLPSQKLYFSHLPVLMLQWNPIGLPLIFSWNHMLENISELLIMLSDTRCLQSSHYFPSSLFPPFLTLTCQCFRHIICFALYTSMHGVTGSPFLGFSIIKVWLLIKFLISSKVAFSPAFLTSDGNLVTSKKILGSGLKW